MKSFPYYGDPDPEEKKKIKENTEAGPRKEGKKGHGQSGVRLMAYLLTP